MSQTTSPRAGPGARPGNAPEDGRGGRRRGGWRKLLLGAGAAIGAVALLAAGAVWFLLATETGARRLFSWLGASMAGSLEVEALDGPVRGPLSLRGLVYESDGFEVRVAALRVEWNLRELLSRRLDITSLDAEGVTVLLADRDERDEEPGPLPDVHLPVNIIVRAAAVRGIQVARPGSEPTAIDSLDLATRAIGNVVEIERLTLKSPEITAAAEGRVAPQGDYPVDLRLEWSAERPGQERWAGRGTFGGTLENLRIQHDLSAPVAAHIEAVLTTPLRDLSFDAEVTARPFRLAALGGDVPEGVTLGGRVRAAGTIEELEAEASLTATTTETGPARLEASLARDGERWRFDRLVLTSPSAPTRVEAEGALWLPEGHAPRFDVRAAWTDVAWPLTGEPALTSPEGRAALEGDLAAWNLVTDLVLAEPLVAAGVPPTRIELRGRGSERRLVLERAAGRLLGGTLTAKGEVAWSPRVEWSLAVDGRALDPAQLWPDHPGRLALSARTEGHLAETGPVARIAPLRLAGALRGEPLDARGAVQLDGERVALSDLDLDWGSIRLSASGLVQPSLDFRFALEAPNLSLALPRAAGSLTASGRLLGPLETPHLAAIVAGEALSWGGGSAAALAAEADLDLAPGGALDLDAEARRLAIGERTFERVTLTGAGSREEHTLTLDAESDEGGLRLAAEGGLGVDETWRGSLRRLDLDIPEAGGWRLAAPAAVIASADVVEVDRLCEVSNGARLCAEGTWRGEAGWRVSAELAAVPLALAAPLLPPDLEISGALDGAAEVRAGAGAGGTITATADLRPGPGEVVYPLPDGGTGTLRFGRGSVIASAGTGGLEAALEVPLPDLGSAAAELALPGYRLAGPLAEDQPISGTLTARVTDLGFLQAFSERLEDTGGRLDADLRIAGTIGRQRVTGRALLEDGRAAVPELGIRLTEMRLLATGEDAAGGETAGDAPGGGGVAPLRIEGSVRSGPGTVTLAGVAPAVPSPESPIRIEIGGRRFLAMNTAEARILADPDLEVTFDGTRIALIGEVVVPEAEVEIAKAPAVAVAGTRDVVYVGGVPPEDRADAGPPIAMRVRVVLGSDVELDVLGLSAEPRGSLLLVDEPGRPTSGTGEIDLAGGTYQAYGQDLKIERGRLVFAGPVDNPRIDLRAFREAKDGVIAGLEAEGTLERPEVTLWSEPPMDQANQLSYLLLGRPIGEASPEDGDVVANAATSLGIKGGNLLAERLAARFGLEEARIETEGSIEEASLVLGKYLSPRLYVAYGVGLFEAANTLRIRYLLGSKWTLEATTGEATAADLLYTIERGRGAKRQEPEDGQPLQPRAASGEGGA